MRNCDCQTPDYDEESGEETWNDDIVVAHSSINCCECTHPINAGEKYRHIKGRWDGNWSTYRMCLSCQTVSDHLSKKLDICHCLGELYDELINSDVLYTLCQEEDGGTIYASDESWLKIVDHNNLRCEVYASH
ncbi:hypothetical protein LC605_24085 [Nostoc sp. CHAB 5836]|uniref:hypothetical protein n=1 Tax=Nostoc sp. CHAB 5836 TaxID=2780404 RepID=UPI001E343437|nr:hypothetical protein [Nostoc sp. CHAB 5836]MCC5618108.1 hypothetical protein [Nostoc sp. CHAB 5836]